MQYPALLRFVPYWLGGYESFHELLDISSRVNV